MVVISETSNPREGKMLILSRKRNEKIMIGKEIVIMIVDIRGDMVQIGIEAPRDIPVHRQEIFDEIQAGVVRPVPAPQPGEAAHPQS